MCDEIILPKQRLINLLQKNPPELFRALERAMKASADKMQDKNYTDFNKRAASTANNIEELIKKINSMNNNDTQVLFNNLTHHYTNIK